MLTFLKSYLRAIKDYYFLKEEILKSFSLSLSKIKSSKIKNFHVAESKNQIPFNRDFVKRMRSIVMKEVVVNAHWEDMYNIGDKKRLVKDLIDMNDMEFYNAVSKPHTNNLHFGFGDICKYVIQNYRMSNFYLNKTVFDTIFRICCSLGIRHHPETYHFVKFNYDESPDSMLEDIFKCLGKTSNFPNIFKGEFGIKTKFGIVSFAPIQQLYHAIKILELTNNLQIKEPRILEIGAGLGLSAYHSRNFGITDYTILDLSLGSLSQSFFFASTIGEENILIGDEILKINQSTEKFKESIKLITSTDIELVPNNIDVIINCDSITEMSKEQAIIYTQMAAKKSKYFLSLNHDNNSFIISQIFKNTPFKRVYRVPTWYRSGYIEELYVNTSLVQNKM